MSTVVITGSNGLVGSEAVSFFAEKGFDIVGIENNLREFFFGKDGSSNWITISNDFPLLEKNL